MCIVISGQVLASYQPERLGAFVTLSEPSKKRLRLISEDYRAKKEKELAECLNDETMTEMCRFIRIQWIAEMAIITRHKKNLQSEFKLKGYSDNPKNGQWRNWQVLEELKKIDQLPTTFVPSITQVKIHLIPRFKKYYPGFLKPMDWEVFLACTNDYGAAFYKADSIIKFQVNETLRTYFGYNKFSDFYYDWCAQNSDLLKVYG